MDKKKILVVEDEALTGEMLIEMIASWGYEAVLCGDGGTAMDRYREDYYPVVITDIEMPGMDGNELIGKIKSLNSDQVIIVLTVHDRAEMIIETMRKGVYDYIIKPAESEELYRKLERAVEAAELRRMKTTLEKEKVVKLENQLEWFKWTEDIITRDYDRVDRSMFQSLHNSFNQGAGFGALLTLISIISSSMKKHGDQYLIDRNMFDLIKDNARFAERTLKVFSDINWVMTNDLPMERVSATELRTFINTIKTDIEQYLELKRHTILISDPTERFDRSYVNISSDHIYKAIHELLFNAMKFSVPDTSIVVMLDMVDDETLVISVLNTVEEVEKGIIGIPMEYENIVFEPFYRLSRQVYEEYETLDYGLGLTVVEKIVRKHGGTISVSNVTDYTDVRKGPVTKVLFTIKIPVEAGDEIGEPARETVRAESA